MRKLILYINACVREDSRTKKLSEALLEKLGGDIKRVNIGGMKFEITDEMRKSIEKLAQKHNLIA